MSSKHIIDRMRVWRPGKIWLGRRPRKTMTLRAI
jgi:hypothetical protein